MPSYYNRRGGNYGRRNYYGKKYGKRAYKGNSAVSIARRALSVASRAGKLLNVEYKHNDVLLNFNLSNDGVGWGITYLTGIAQGDDNTNRNGLAIRVVSVYLTGHVYIDSLSSTQGSAVVRVAVIRDKSGNGLIPNTADIFRDNSPTSVLNTVYAGTRFEIVLSAKFHLDYGNVGGRVLDEFRNIKEGSVEYKGATANTSDSATGHLWLVHIWEDVGTSVGATVPILGTARITYVDN